MLVDRREAIKDQMGQILYLAPSPLRVVAAALLDATLICPEGTEVLAAEAAAAVQEQEMPQAMETLQA